MNDASTAYRSAQLVARELADELGRRLGNWKTGDDVSPSWQCVARLVALNHELTGLVTQATAPKRLRNQ